MSSETSSASASKGSPNAHSSSLRDRIGKGLINFVDNIKMAIAILILLPFSPFMIDAFFRKCEKDIPSTWVYGWKRLRTNANCILIISTITWLRLRCAVGWGAFFCDGLILVIALKGLFLNVWDLIIYVLLPHTPGIIQTGGEVLLDKVEKGCKDFLTLLRDQYFKEITANGVVFKLVKGLTDFGFDLGRRYAQEILVRGSLIYLSLRYALLLLFLILTFSATYDWLALVSPHYFYSAGGNLCFIDFVFFSVDILTTSSISGMSAATYLAKTVAILQLGLSFLSLVLFIPLIFVSYDRAILMSEEIRGTRERHKMKGLAEFVEAKTGVPVEQATKLLRGELEQSKIDVAEIKIPK